jgi:pilus assembly protein Flp/PilA
MEGYGVRSFFMKNLILDFLKDEEGQTSTEYILLVAVVALIVFKFREIATEKLSSLTSTIFNKAEQSINNELP